MSRIDDFIKGNRSRLLEELIGFLRIPSVSTLSAHAEDCRRAAEWLSARLERLGCRVELLGNESYPVVHAVGPVSAGAPTVVVYGHYDVQPAEPEDLWLSPPFEPTLRTGNLYARGATDDKGQLYSIISAFEAAGIKEDLPLNVRFLIEGQEESGGAVLEEVVNARPDLVEADVALVADGPYYARGWPAVEIAVRGICYSEINVVTLRRDLHSGLFGGVAPNAHEVLTRILAALKTPGGTIRIPGLYDNIRRPSRMEREAWSRLPFDESKFLRREVGARLLVGPTRHSVLERLWSQPTLDIHGIAGGFVGEGARTVIPAEATAKVSLRLVPDQRADVVFRQLRDAVRGLAPRWAKVTCRCLLAADPVLLDTAHPAFAYMNSSFEEVEGRDVVYTRSGGSLPILSTLGRGGAAVILAGIGLPDDAPHGPNEKLSIVQFEKGARVFGRFFQRMATLHSCCRNTTGADTGERTNNDRKNMARTNQDRANE